MKFNMKLNTECRDSFEFHELYRCPKPTPSLNTEIVRSLAEGFNNNTLRIQKISLFPAILSRCIVVAFRATTKANIEVADVPFIDQDVLIDKGLGDAWMQRYKELSKEERELTDDADHLYQGARYFADILCEAPGEWVGCTAVESMFESAILQAWTAFEVLAGDLWVAAIDARPKELGERAMKSSPDLRGDKAASKGISENVIELMDYNITSIGMAFKKNKKFNWNRLGGIREGYTKVFGRAFDKAVFEPFDNKLFAAESIRNVLLHSGGKVDLDFKKRMADRPDAFAHLDCTSSVKLDDRLVFKGGDVLSILTSLVACGSTMLEQVDKHLSSTSELPPE